MQHNSRVESLDLTDNGMSEEAQLHVIEVLRHNNAISSLVSMLILLYNGFDYKICVERKVFVIDNLTMYLKL